MLDGRDLQLMSNLLDQKLDEKLKPIQEDISVLKVEMKEVKQDIAVLKEDVTVLKEDIAILKEDVNVLKQDSAELKKGVRKLNDDLINLRIDHSRVEKKIDDYYAQIENTYVTEKEGRSVYQTQLKDTLDQLIRKAKQVCPLSSHLITYMTLHVNHEGWSVAV